MFLPHVPEATAELNHKGYRVLAVTNQACVGRGELTHGDLAFPLGSDDDSIENVQLLIEAKSSF